MKEGNKRWAIETNNKVGEENKKRRKKGNKKGRKE